MTNDTKITNFTQKYYYITAQSITYHGNKCYMSVGGAVCFEQKRLQDFNSISSVFKA